MYLYSSYNKGILIQFLTLLRAGLWEKEAKFCDCKDLDFSKLMQIAEEQSVVGLITAGLERVKNTTIPQPVVLQFIGATLQIEQRNKEMNFFVARLVEHLRKADVYAILVKGQGIAQCYERPLWRACGDIDLLLTEENYKKAQHELTPLASEIKNENKEIFHHEMTIDSWIVELHGSLCSRLWKSVNNGIKDAQLSVFIEGRVRSWMNCKSQIFLPRADEDVIFVFTHILQHFYHEGIGLRQVCDWCRLIWTYRENLDLRLLETRIDRMGIMSEWKAFGALAIGSLGMPEESMPFYSSALKWRRKADRIMAFILETGNFGHNRDFSYYSQKSLIKRKAVSLFRHTKDAFKYFMVFPLDSVKVWSKMIVEGFEKIIKG